jgi:hypothetical protein
MATRKNGNGRSTPELAEAWIELTMSLLPIIVVFLVMLYINQPLKVFAKPEWAFGAAILFGQSLVRLLAAMIKPHKPVRVGEVVLFAVAIMVLGLVPSLLCLVFLIHGAEQPDGVPTVFKILQTVLFFISAAVYLVVGGVTHGLATPTQFPKA